MSYIEENGYFVFDGVKSSDYGVWINGGGTFDAPKRRSKEYVVPGRNGSLTIDEGVYEELEHKYPAFIPNDFSANIEKFRIELLKRDGYAKLVDSYHPEEFYRARYTGGMKTNVAAGGVGGAFDIVFSRDPRRFLASGEDVMKFPPGGKRSNNLLPLNAVSQYEYGVEWKSENGVVTANGMLKLSVSEFTVRSANPWDLTGFTLPKGTYILCGCPAGGGETTYRMSIRNYNNGTYGEYLYDEGEGVEFDVTDTSDWWEVKAIVYQAKADNLVFKPMIYNKYGENIVDYPYTDGTKTSYGVTYTPTDGGQGAGEVALSNVCSGGTSTFGVYSNYDRDAITLSPGTYKLTGCPAGGGANTYELNACGYSDYGSGKTFTLTEETTLNVTIRVRNGVSATGLVFRPVLQRTENVSEPDFEINWDRRNEIYNPTSFEARPLLKVHLTGSGNGQINTGTSQTITISYSDRVTSDLYIDCETQDCYGYDSHLRIVNLNNTVSFSDGYYGDFPTFKPGVNKFSISGDIEYVEVTPRWWIV